MSTVPQRSVSFADKAAVAIALMVGFYVLAGGLVLLLGWLIYASVAYGRFFNVKIVAVCAVAAFAVLKGCFFISDGFEPPGPEITARDQPKLFGLIRAVADQVGAKMPSHVYLVPDVNAFVAEVGGWLGIFGARRVMGIGVGMLNTDSIGQLRATIAHEFGHFQGGDTRLGGFIYRTRASMGRVIVHLGEDSLLSLPFLWYAEMFQKITLAIARHQELAADALSVRVAGLDAHIEGLRRESVGGALFHKYLDDEVTPILEEGYAPRNIYDGFRGFLTNLGEDGILKRVEEVLNQQETDPTDTHPSLRDRIAFAQSLPNPRIPDLPESARTLLVNPDLVEQTITGGFLAANVREFDRKKSISWEQASGLVYAKRMETFAHTFDEVLCNNFNDPSLTRILRTLETGDRAAIGRAVAHRIGNGSEPVPEDRIVDVLTSVILARVGTELVKRQTHKWVLMMGRPLELHDLEGNPLLLGDAIQAAVESPTNVPALRARLEALGLTVA